MNTAQKTRLIKFSQGCQIDEKLWFFANGYNALCYLNQEDFSITFATGIPSEETVNGALYRNIEVYDNKLVLIPFNAREIAIYDLLNGNITKIPLKENADVSQKFNASIIINDCIYMIPRKYPALVELNMITYEVTYHTEWMKKIQPNEWGFFFGRYIVRTERGVVAVSRSANVVMEFDVMRGCSLSYSYLDKESDYICIAKKDNTYLLVDGGNYEIVIKKNLRDDGGTVIKFLDKSEEKHIIHFLVVSNKLVYLVPKETNKITCVDVDREEVFTVQGSNDSGSYDYVWLYQNKLHAFNAKHMVVDVYDEDGTLVQKTIIHISNSTICEIYLNHIKEQRMVYEGLFGIDELILHIEGNIVKNGKG